MEKRATFFTPKEIHEGHDGIMHGGLSGAILDEVMGRCNFVEAADGTLYNPYVTGEMTVRYDLPIRVGTKMRAFGRIDRSGAGQGKILTRVKFWTRRAWLSRRQPVFISERISSTTKTCRRGKSGGFGP